MSFRPDAGGVRVSSSDQTLSTLCKLSSVDDLLLPCFVMTFPPCKSPRRVGSFPAPVSNQLSLRAVARAASAPTCWLALASRLISLGCPPCEFARIQLSRLRMLRSASACECSHSPSHSMRLFAVGKLLSCCFQCVSCLAFVLWRLSCVLCLHRLTDQSGLASFHSLFSPCVCFVSGSGLSLPATCLIAVGTADAAEL